MKPKFTPAYHNGWSHSGDPWTTEHCTVCQKQSDKELITVVFIFKTQQ